MVSTLLQGVLTATVVIAAYYLMPFVPSRNASPFFQLTIGLSSFALVLLYQMRAILTDEFPMRRAATGTAILLPLFIVIFSWVYLVTSFSYPDSFAEPFTRTQALYFTITVFTTVGFGDITPLTDGARIITIVQMICNVILIAVVFRLMFGVASKRAARKQSEQ